eukprot:m.230644 g.230644  ORF g.230644 m.230644 type:complete len:1080 (+) comp17354_c0_seq4:65-3304(+)
MPARRVLLVAEKPTVAKGISQILQPGCRRQGTDATYVGLWDLNANINGEMCSVKVTSVLGHLMTWDFPPAFRSWHGCDPGALFSAPVKHMINDKPDDDNCTKVKKVLQRYAKTSDLLIIATDNDREGENIGFEIIEVCKAVNRRLQTKRMKFSAVTNTEINRSLRTLVEPDKRTSDACVTRQQLDLRIGAIFTRFQTMRLQAMYPSKFGKEVRRKPISYGPCQFPTLGFVVERYRSHEQFLPEDFWKLKVLHQERIGDQDYNVEFSWQRGRLFDELLTNIYADMCRDAGQARVTRVIAKPRSKYRPVGLTTTEMQKIASRRYRISPADALAAAEKLYQKGIVSYPRTETDQFEASMDLEGLVALHAAHPDWGAFAASLNGHVNPRNGRNTDEAHPPIHPTKSVNNLNGREAQVYELISRHFLACCSRDAQGQETVVNISLAEEEFTAKGLVISDRGYLEVYHPYDSWRGTQLPAYTEGQLINVSVEVVEGETSAPKLLTEADLLSLMSRYEIGTDATMAEHIKNVLDREYVSKAVGGQELVPTTLGMALVDAYDNMSFEISVSRPDLRREMEADMKSIVRGRKTMQGVIDNCITQYQAVYDTVVNELPVFDATMVNQFGPAEAAAPQGAPTAALRRCPDCKSADQVLNTTQAGRWKLGCMNYPTCKSRAVWLDRVTNAVLLDQGCPSCGLKMVKLTIKAGVLPSWLSSNGDVLEGCLMCNSDIQDYAGRDRLHISQGSSQPSQARGRAPRQPRQPRQPPRNDHNDDDDDDEDDDMLLAALEQAENSQSQGRQPRPPRARARSPSPSDDVQTLECGCNQPCVSYVTKQGQNEGRRFYKCANKDQGGCDLFVFEDSLGPPCNCKRPSSRFEAKSGVVYLKCLLGDNGCGFFQAENEYGASTKSFGGGSQGRGQGQAEAGMRCNCGQAAVMRTVRKEGANKGRQFYCCSKPSGDDARCDFFMWADDTEDDHAKPNFDDKNKQQFRSKSKGPGSDVECYKCHQMGHFASNCPQGGGGGASRGGKRGPNTGGIVCYKCQQPGHFASNCPDNGGGGGGGGPRPKKARTCSVCKQQGHDKRSCPNK